MMEVLLSGQVLRSGIKQSLGGAAFVLVEAAFPSRLVGEGSKSCQGCTFLPSVSPSGLKLSSRGEVACSA